VGPELKKNKGVEAERCRILKYISEPRPAGYGVAEFCATTKK